MDFDLRDVSMPPYVSGDVLLWVNRFLPSFIARIENYLYMALIRFSIKLA